MAGTMDSGTQTSDIGSDEEFDPNPNLGNASPRVVIDTSPPFNSVEEAVIRFGGRGFWIPRTFLDHPPPPPITLPRPQAPQEIDISKLEERTAAMLKDLDMKEQETLGILKELELTKRLVEELKLKLPDQTADKYNHTTKPEEYSNSCPSSTMGLIMTELKQAKLNLYQNTNELAAIRASVESLGRKLDREQYVVEKSPEIQSTTTTTTTTSINPLVISRELRELNYEAEQFMKTAESARSEVLNAMSEIEQTKSGLRMIEMRWVAAKKLEEAAKAAESLALAEIRSLSNNEDKVSETNYYQQKPGRISLSIEEYSALTDKARKAESLFKRKDLLSKIGWEEVLGRVEAMNRRKSGSTQRELDFANNECNNTPLRKPTTSIGDILSTKLVLRDDLEVERPVEEVNGRQRVSLNQMLRRQRGETTSKDHENRESNSKSKHFFSRRKAFGFVHISLPTSKQSK